MKQTIEIEVEVPDGKTAVWKDGKIVYEDIEPQLPKTWEEFCEQSEIRRCECYLDINCDILEVRKGERRKNEDRNLLPSKKAAEQHLALMQLHQLRDCYRQGWKPNYSEQSDDEIWYISKYDDEFDIKFTSGCVSFLSFPTREIAYQFLTNFQDLIKEAGDLI